MKLTNKEIKVLKELAKKMIKDKLDLEKGSKESDKWFKEYIRK